MNEVDLLRHIQTRSATPASRGAVEIGPGDDAAVIRVGDEQVLLTVDHLVEGTHFNPIGQVPPDAIIDRIARKAVARSISDIAAMGGTPIASLATACFPPDFPQERANLLFDRMHAWAIRWQAPLVGGDIAQSPSRENRPHDALVLTVTVVGRPHPARGPVLRSTASPGDSLWVTGRLGNSLRSERHLTFEPRITESTWLCSRSSSRSGRPVPSAMIDLSDGLGRDAGRLALASNVRIEIDADAIPRHDDCRDWQAAASDGEDYEILFTVPPETDLSAMLQATGTPATRIGIVAAGEPGCSVRTGADTTIDAASMGWDHGTH
ncbi:MAG: thiamine-phosphate kinase [Phycisphaeraceae bacterium]|nr:thiamine-phosphate kinase [Phycisphaerae bacterium]MBX3393242.1 thiamine-phosphate kinase [Phycisphaeraceae bacterium]HRJ49039.1 thiamine-phosphate kinase [Phycisphaerales bacterium]